MIDDTVAENSLTLLCPWDQGHIIYTATSRQWYIGMLLPLTLSSFALSLFSLSLPSFLSFGLSRHHPSDFPLKHSEQLSTVENIPMIRRGNFAIPTLHLTSSSSSSRRRRRRRFRKQHLSKQGGIPFGSEKDIETTESERDFPLAPYENVG